MKLLDALRKARHDGATGAITTPSGFERIKDETNKEARDKRLREDISVNPSLYNRLTRRLHGFRSRAVPKGWVQPESSFFVPRYVRRHALKSRPVTRRQRRIAARITRIAARYGAKP